MPTADITTKVAFNLVEFCGKNC